MTKILGDVDQFFAGQDMRGHGLSGDSRWKLINWLKNEFYLHYCVPEEEKSSELWVARIKSFLNCLDGHHHFCELYGRHCDRNDHFLEEMPSHYQRWFFKQKVEQKYCSTDFSDEMKSMGTTSPVESRV